MDFLLSERRDVAAAKRFFRKAMKNHATPRVITLDAYAASHRAITDSSLRHMLPQRTVPKLVRVSPCASATIRSSNALVIPYTLDGAEALSELIAMNRSKFTSASAALISELLP